MCINRPTLNDCNQDVEEYKSRKRKGIMSSSQLIESFQQTLEMSNHGLLGKRTDKAQKSNRVYKEGFVSKVEPRHEQPSIIVEANTSFAAAKNYRRLGKVAVLNFANPENPGGGVRLGAMAQEECLCRSSNLFCCLNAPNVYTDYYAYHRNREDYFSSDRLIYTKDVTVFKDDSVAPRLMPQREWCKVDVITCAAPYLAGGKYTSSTALMLLFKSRIRNIIESACDNEADVLILGAFGCGAFKNPPLIVAEAFRQVLCEENYCQRFKQIVFAIKPTGECCENLAAFAQKFDGYAPPAKRARPCCADE